MNEQAAAFEDLEEIANEKQAKKNCLALSVSSPLFCYH